MTYCNLPVAELATFTAGDFTREWLGPWCGSLEPNPPVGETMRYMLARYTIHVASCGGGRDDWNCTNRCEAHGGEISVGGPLQYVHQLAASMIRDGWVGEPVDVSLERRFLHDGHHRSLAAMMAGLETVPVVDYSHPSADGLLTSL
jgi:hypothetical protein